MKFLTKLFKRKTIHQLTLSTKQYCLVDNFHHRLKGDDRIYWLHWLNKNINTQLRPNVVIDLTDKKKAPKRYDLPCDGVALNLALVSHCINLSRKELSQNGTINIYKILYQNL
ncbi:MAG: hypothetical protein QF441_16120 [Bacteriovoracaceae bacterium]|jgi:hypothetical protein|nr:hypothetical protein [Bacteriovoracaceae bacterium]